MEEASRSGSASDSALTVCRQRQAPFDKKAAKIFEITSVHGSMSPSSLERTYRYCIEEELKVEEV